MSQVARILKQARKMPYLVRSADHVDTAAEGIAADRIAPVIPCSAVTGEVRSRTLEARLFVRFFVA